MNRLTATTALGVVITVAAAAQAGLTGHWEGQTDGGAQLALDLTVKDSAVTGTLTRDGPSAPIVEGKTTGARFTFKATVNDKTEGFTGELAGDDLKFWLDRQGPAKAVVLKRVKSK